MRRELAYARDQLAGLGKRHSSQRLEARQIAKATLAAVLAWFVADRLMPHETVWIAPATAVIMVHSTVHQTLTNGLRRVAAVAAGVILAGSIGHLLGLNALSLVLVVPPALLAARWRHMGRHGSDVATTAVLMLSFGAASQERYLLAYVAATAIGAVAGGVVNSLLWPPLYRRRSDQALRHLSRRAAMLLDNIADALRRGWDLSGLPDWQRQAEHLAVHLASAEAAVSTVAESRRYNLRHLITPAPTDHSSLLAAMSQIAIHVNAIVRALIPIATHDPDEGPAAIGDRFAHDYAHLLDTLAQALRIQPPLPDDLQELGKLLDHARRQAAAMHQQMTDEVRTGQLDHPQGWAASGSLLTDLERIITILIDLQTPSAEAGADHADEPGHDRNAPANRPGCEGERSIEAEATRSGSGNVKETPG